MATVSRRTVCIRNTSVHSITYNSSLDTDIKQNYPQVELCLESAIDPIKVSQFRIPSGLVDNLMAWRMDETPRVVQDDVEWADIKVFPKITPEMIEMVGDGESQFQVNLNLFTEKH